MPVDFGQRGPHQVGPEAGLISKRVCVLRLGAQRFGKIEGGVLFTRKGAVCLGVVPDLLRQALPVAIACLVVVRPETDEPSLVVGPTVVAFVAHWSSSTVMRFLQCIALDIGAIVL